MGHTVLSVWILLCILWPRQSVSVRISTGFSSRYSLRIVYFELRKPFILVAAITYVLYYIIIWPLIKNSSVYIYIEAQKGQYFIFNAIYFFLLQNVLSIGLKFVGYRSLSAFADLCWSFGRCHMYTFSPKLQLHCHRLSRQNCEALGCT